jgi:hypothetical protein
MYLARKVTLSKWNNMTDIDQGQVPGDVSYDIRTNSNKLSVWLKQDDSTESTEEVALALASGLQRFDKMDILWIEKRKIEEAGFEVHPSPGRTPVASLVNNHFDIVGLHFSDLSRLASLFAESIAANMTKRLTQKKLESIVVSAVEAERLSIDKLDPKLASCVSELKS